MKALRFSSRSFAELRFADDLSSIASRLILRPFTPPLAFSAPMRALHPVSEPLLADAAIPVSDEMYPRVMSLAVTPGELPDWAPALVASRPPVASPSPAVTASARSAHCLVRCIVPPGVVTPMQGRRSTYCEPGPDVRAPF